MTDHKKEMEPVLQATSIRLREIYRVAYEAGREDERRELFAIFKDKLAEFDAKITERLAKPGE
jgi:hypothetical protein